MIHLSVLICSSPCLSIGGQDLMFTLDTASSDLWVASAECSDEDCRTVKTYANTSTFKSAASGIDALQNKPFTLRYVQGRVDGGIGYETVTLGGIEVNDQVFGLVTKVSSINMSGVGNSGILGLAFPKSSSIQRILGKTLIENIYEALDENNRFFAFKLGGSDEASSFTIGHIDSKMLTNTSLSFFPVYPTNAFDTSTYDYWKIPLNHITFDGNRFALSISRVKGSKTTIATLDTGTTLILGPTRDVTEFWKAVGGARRDEENRFWMIRCNRGIAVDFVFGGEDGIDARAYSIHPRDLSWNGTKKGEWCMGGIQGNDEVISTDWLLGDTFLRVKNQNVYATHHAATSSTPPFIGLANRTDSVTAMTDFQAERGHNSIIHVGTRVPPSPLHSGSMVPVLLSSLAGFVVGLMAILIFKLKSWDSMIRPRLFRGLLR
ncbi:acid protease [Ramaria rubella]|nr:acid protease [Ramaria rubella]